MGSAHAFYVGSQSRLNYIFMAIKCMAGGCVFFLEYLRYSSEGNFSL